MTQGEANIGNESSKVPYSMLLLRLNKKKKCNISMNIPIEHLGRTQKKIVMAMHEMR